MDTPKRSKSLVDSVQSPWRSPQGCAAGKRSLDSFRKMKRLKHANVSPMPDSPLPPRLAALLSCRIDRYGHNHRPLELNSPSGPSTSVSRLTFQDGDEEVVVDSPVIPTAIPEFKESYLSSVLEPDGILGECESHEAPALWQTLRRLQASGAALNTAVTSRSEKLRGALHSNPQQGGNQALSAAMGELKAAVDQREMVDQQLSSTIKALDVLGSLPAGEGGWAVSRVDTPPQDNSLALLQEENVKLSSKLDLAAKQVQYMEDRSEEVHKTKRQLEEAQELIVILRSTLAAAMEPPLLSPPPPPTPPLLPPTPPAAPPLPTSAQREPTIDLQTEPAYTDLPESATCGSTVVSSPISISATPPSLEESSALNVLPCLDGQLTLEFSDTVGRLNEMAAAEILRNRMLTARRTGVSLRHFSMLSLQGGVASAEKDMWESLTYDSEMTHSFTTESKSTEVDHVKFNALVDQAFLAGTPTHLSSATHSVGDANSSFRMRAPQQSASRSQIQHVDTNQTALSW